VQTFKSVFSPAADRHCAPIDGCLYKKLFDLFFPFANASLNHHLKAIEMGYFLLQYVIFSQKRKQMVLPADKKDTVDRESRSAEPRR
jgi:hypothetical protein